MLMLPILATVILLQLRLPATRLRFSEEGNFHKCAHPGNEDGRIEPFWKPAANHEFKATC